MIETLAIGGYRSLRELVLPLGQLNVVTGANGSGKSSLYRALRLFAETSTGGAVASLAREGGLISALWAGPEHTSWRMRDGDAPIEGAARRRGPVRLRLGFASEAFGYSIEFGLPPQDKSTRAGTAFANDPEIKRECIFTGPAPRSAAMLVERINGFVRARDKEHDWHHLRSIDQDQSMLGELGDPLSAPELLLVRERVRAWRFYDQFRTDEGAPARARTIGTRTAVLAADGRDLAAALQTIIEIGDRDALAETIAAAFDGSTLSIDHDTPRFGIEMRQPGLLRPLDTSELSDGTLRYLLRLLVSSSCRSPSVSCAKARASARPSPATGRRKNRRCASPSWVNRLRKDSGESDRRHGLRATAVTRNGRRQLPAACSARTTTIGKVY